MKWRFSIFDKVLVAIDGSEESVAATKLAISKLSESHNVHLVHALMTGAPVSSLVEMAKRYGFADQLSEDLTDVEVMPTPPSGGGVMVATVVPRPTLEKFGKLLLQHVVQHSLRVKLNDAQLHVISDDPVKAIVGCAKELGAELIVMGSRGHGKLKSLVVGSVSQSVVVEANCPVVLTK